MYKGTDWVVNGRSRGVLYRLTIYTRRDTKANHPLNISIRRMVFSEGIQESSRLAILRICNIYAHKLQDTVFRYHPCASTVDLPTRYPSTDGERNATVVHLAQFAAAQEESLELAAIDSIDGRGEDRHIKKKLSTASMSMRKTMMRKTMKKKIQRKTQNRLRSQQSPKHQRSLLCLHWERLFLLHQSRGTKTSLQGCPRSSRSIAGGSAVVAMGVTLVSKFTKN